mmetsp:Transcript_16075/g.39370  ORF Transcript_16075/g.39370 Transcript_16075/m.39370 type:complete len:174 (-) Transcript_16075:19-540(-)
MDAVSQLVVEAASPVVVEIGPGAGHATKAIFDKFSPSRVYGIEISEAFRNRLTEAFPKEIEDGVFSVHSEDAKDLNFIPDGSVDAIFAFNVIYFLDPFPAYLKECQRILKPGGSVNFGVKPMAKKLDPTVYKNTDWDKCLEEMKAAGFPDAEAKEERLEGGTAYIPIVGTKSA